MLKCENCNNNFEEKITLNSGKILWLSSRKFCPDCSPIGQRNTRAYIVDIPNGFAYCVKCQQPKPRKNFYNRKNGAPLSYCIDCQKDVKELKLQENLERLVEERQGACIDCGGIYPLPVYEFYKNGEIFGLSKTKNMSFQKIKEELEGYDMLCRNCSALRRWERDGR